MTLRRCPSGHGKSIEAQRPSPMPCGAARTLYHGAPCARSFAATRPPPMAQWPTPSARVVPVLAARTDGGGIHAAPRRSGGAQSVSLAGKSDAVVEKTPAAVRVPPQCLHQLSAGDALETRVKTPVAPDASPGWTMVWRAWATRVLWARPCGRHDRTMGQQARGLVCQVIEPTGDRTLRIAGERREGSRWCALGRHARRNGTRGRPQKTLPQGGTGRLQPTGAHRPQRGPQRPHAPAPSPEPPDTAQPLATHELPAPHLAACQTSLRRRWAASRRRTHR